MKIKTLQWNIGGGKIRLRTSGPEIDSSYSVEGIGYIGDYIKEVNPDIVTLQETHSTATSSQVEELANKLGYPYFFNDQHADSHIDPTQKLGQAVLSKFPIVGHTFQKFYNPLWRVVRPNGDVWISMDKGISTCQLQIDDQTTLGLSTLHAIPFGSFKIDPLSEDAKEVRQSTAQLIIPKTDKFIIQGDFNFDQETVKPFLPELFENGAQEVPLTEATTPSNRKLDHIIYGGISLTNSQIFKDALTDHFPVIAEFEI